MNHAEYKESLRWTFNSINALKEERSIIFDEEPCCDEDFDRIREIGEDLTDLFYEVGRLKREYENKCHKKG